MGKLYFFYQQITMIMMMMMMCVCVRAFQKWNVEAIDRDIETAPVDPRARVTRAVVIRLPGTY